MKTSNGQTNFLPNHQQFHHEILTGLLQSPKSISPKFLYDERGSELFEKICELQEYYPVHAETEILKTHAHEMAGWIGKNAVIIEPGCGNCVKVRTLLNELETPRAYVALDISEDFLEKTAQALAKRFPQIPIHAVVADYTGNFSLPIALDKMPEKRVIFFPGSTIGNLDPSEAKTLLKRMHKLVRKKGGLLIGVDMKKDKKILELAYDDPAGVTAEFNYNLLDRLNREFSGSFDRKQFAYQATYNGEAGRVEMFLVSRAPHSVHLGDQQIQFAENETIHTEDSYKYAPEEFIALGESAGFHFKTRWTDARDRFCMYYFERD